MVRSPSGVTRITDVPVGVSLRTMEASTPEAVICSMNRSPMASRPTAPLKTGCQSPSPFPERPSNNPRTAFPAGLASQATPRVVLAALPPGQGPAGGQLAEKHFDFVVIHEVHAPRLLAEALEKLVVDVRDDVHQGIFHPEDRIHPLPPLHDRPPN